MNILFYLLIIYLIVINLIAVVITVYDKHSAKKHKWRVKERTLLIVSALGGSAGMYITMHIIRHKTKHLKFMLGIPLIFFAELSVIIAMVYFYGK
ncbi:MAG: DUF1294 domain-containing protein [Ruminococcus sp.]|nr:DUF1294 domain-containing protein [Ruminococcus sp.]